MAITSINSVGGGVSALPSATSAAESEQRFLKLLVAQLNNQDPTNPMDNAQLTSQLAQMSTVSGIEKLNTAMESLLAQTGSSQVLQSAGLIGRSVLTTGNDIVLNSDTPSFSVELPADAASVKATITDSSGKVVRSFDLGAMPKGIKTLSWDGKNDSGVAVADGNYKLNLDGGGAQALTFSKVTSVAQGPNGVALDLTNGKKVGFSDIRQIK